jgi:hypothetical protein
MTKRNLTLIITILLLQFSCTNKKKVEDENVYSLGIFYSNNKQNSKDISNHFENNCHYFLLLKLGKIEIYNRESENPDKKDFSVTYTPNQKELSRFIKIINFESKRKKKTRELDNNFLYCGNTYVSCVDNIDNSIFYISEFGLKDEDEDFIFKLIKKGKTKNKIMTSSKLIKEKYFMLGLLHQETLLIITEEPISFPEPRTVEK